MSLRLFSCGFFSFCFVHHEEQPECKHGRNVGEIFTARLRRKPTQEVNTRLTVFFFLSSDENVERRKQIISRFD